MKTITFIIILFSIIGSNVLIAQNGIYQSTKFEFISKNEPSRNRVEYKNNTLTFQINEFNGEFIGGKILWEMKNQGQSEFLEMSLVSLKNSFYDENNNAFVKVYKSQYFGKY